MVSTRDEKLHIRVKSAKVRWFVPAAKPVSETYKIFYGDESDRDKNWPKQSERLGLAHKISVNKVL